MMRYSSERGSRAWVRKSRFSRRNLWVGFGQLSSKSMNIVEKSAKAHSKQYIKPPLGPRPISSITSSREMRSLMSRSGS